MSWKLIRNEFVIAFVVLSIVSCGFLWRPIFVHQNIVPFDIIEEFDDASVIQSKAQNYLLSDVMHQFYPAAVFAKEELSSGRIPWINPHQFGGIPFFADPQNRLFEFTRLVILPFGGTPVMSMLLSAILTLALAGFFMYGFLRSIRMPYFIAYGGAIAWMLSGPMAVWLQYPLVSAALWIPAVLWALTKVIRGARRPFLFLLACGIFFQALAGQPQILALSALLYVAYGLFLFFRFPKPRPRKIAETCMMLFVFTMLATTFQLGPATQFIRSSAAYDLGRGTSRVSLSEELQSTFGNPVATLKSGVKKIATFGVTTVLPNYYGNPLTRNYRFPEQNVLWNYSEMASYASMLVALLALASLFLLKKPKILFWIVAALAAFGFSARLPIFTFIEHMPVFGKINIARFRFILVFALICLAAITLDHFTKRFKHGIRVSLNALFMIAITVDLFAVYSGYNPGADTQLLATYKNSTAITLLTEHPNGRILGLGKSGSSFRSPLVPNMATVLRVDDIRGSNPVTPKSVSDFAKAHLDYKGSYVLASALPENSILEQLAIGTVICEQSVCDQSFPRNGWKKVIAEDRMQVYISDKPTSDNLSSALAPIQKPAMRLWILLSIAGAAGVATTIFIAFRKTKPPVRVG